MLTPFVTTFLLRSILISNPPFLAQTSSSDQLNLTRFQFNRRQLGTEIRLILYASNETKARHLANRAFNRIHELSRIFSTYHSNSELSRLSSRAGQGAQVVSQELFQVLERSLWFAEASGGAFDPTVGPWVQLWKRTRETKRLPRREEFQILSSKVDPRKLQLNSESQTALLKSTGMKLDLDGIAKGFIADEALSTIQAGGVQRALVDAGGDIVIGDPPPGRKGWKILMDSGTELKPLFKGGLLLSNIAIATSGSTQRYVEVDSIRYSHIVDPRTGRGLKGLFAITVLADDGLTADALATTLSVLEPDKGLRLVESVPGAGAVIVRKSGSSMRRWASNHFPLASGEN